MTAEYEMFAVVGIDGNGRLVWLLTADESTARREGHAHRSEWAHVMIVPVVAFDMA